jgi:hypothetical protein
MADKKEHRSSCCCAKCSKNSWARCVPLREYLCRQCFRSHLDACVTCQRKLEPIAEKEVEKECQTAVVGATPTTSRVHGRPTAESINRTRECANITKNEKKEDDILEHTNSLLVESIAEKRKIQKRLQRELDEVESSNASAESRLRGLIALNIALEQKIGLAVVAHLTLHD